MTVTIKVEVCETIFQTWLKGTRHKQGLLDKTCYTAYSVIISSETQWLISLKGHTVTEAQTTGYTTETDKVRIKYSATVFIIVSLFIRFLAVKLKELGAFFSFIWRLYSACLMREGV